MACSEQRASSAATQNWRNTQRAPVDDAAGNETDPAQAVDRLLLDGAQLFGDTALAAATSSAGQTETSAAAAQAVAAARRGGH